MKIYLYKMKNSNVKIGPVIQLAMLFILFSLHTFLISVSYFFKIHLRNRLLEKPYLSKRKTQTLK